MRRKRVGGVVDVMGNLITETAGQRRRQLKIFRWR